MIKTGSNKIKLLSSFHRWRQEKETDDNEDDELAMSLLGFKDQLASTFAFSIHA